MRVGAVWRAAVTAAIAVVCLARAAAPAQQEAAPPGAITAEALPAGGAAEATATATGTVTATEPAATPTPTRMRPVTPTAVPPTPSLTPTPTPDVAARIAAIGTGGGVWFALGALLTLCAVWLGARLAGGRDRLERRRARHTQASAILLELRRLDAVLRRMVALDNPASFPSLDHPIIEAALRDLTLFAAQTAARITQFHGALRGIEHEIADYRDTPLRRADRLSELNQLIKARAAAACRVVPELRKALEKEGGAPPPHLGESALAANGDGTARLPPPPFGAGEGDDWTM